MTGTTSLMDIVNEHLSSSQLQLPVLSPSAMQLQTILSSEDPDFDEISAKIMQDQTLSSQTLRMANSAFYGGLKQISTIKEAILRLGTNEVRNLVLLSIQRQAHSGANAFIKPYMAGLWKHAACCAMGSQFLANRLGRHNIAQEAFLAGLLHDIGHLFLLRVLDTIQSSKTNGANIAELSSNVLSEILDNMHTSQGALLLQHWNLPELYCDVARLHHREDYDYGNTVITIVRLANLACHKLGIGLHHDPSIVLATTEEATVLQLPEVLLAELEITLEDAMESTH